MISGGRGIRYQNSIRIDGLQTQNGRTRDARRIHRRPGPRVRRSGRWHRKPLRNFILSVQLISKARNRVDNRDLNGRGLATWPRRRGECELGSRSPGRIAISYRLRAGLRDMGAVGECLDAF